MSNFTYSKKGNKYYMHIGKTRITVLWKKRWIPKWEEENIEILPTNMILNQENPTLEREESVQLLATFEPDDVTNKAVTYSVSEEGIVTIEGSTVTGYAPGETVITVTSVADKTVSASTKFTVVPKTYIVTFNANGGTGEMASQNPDENSMFTVPQCTFVGPDEKIFVNWTVGSTTYNPGDELLIDSNKEFVANWE